MGYLWEAVARRFTKVGQGVSRELRMTQLESLAVAQLEGGNFERLRSGTRFGGGCQVIANGIAPVSAIPTTTATLFLYNTEPGGGKSIVVEQLGFALGSGTAAAGATLFAAVTNGKPAAVPAAASNYSSQCLSGNPSKASIARWATAITIPSGSAWINVVSTFQLAAANVGQGDHSAQILGGGFLIRPGYGLGLGILSGAGTSPLYAVSAIWDEIDLDVE